MINFFNFKKLSDQYLLTNDFGKYVFLDNNQFAELIAKKDVSDNDLREELKEQLFIFDTSKEAFTDKYHHDMFKAKEYLYSSTQLFIFVVTTACNHNCEYCQAQNGKKIPNDYMSREVAKKAVDIAVQSPTDSLQFEFQGGEPLLNFDVIKYIIEYAESIKGDKKIGYSVVTNLTLLKDSMVAFFKEHSVMISTSIDGPEEVHNNNRPCRDGKKSLEIVLSKIEELKHDKIWVGALQTTTKRSLPKYKEIVDTYLEIGFDTISLRPLTPLGCASNKWDEIGYTAEEYLDFYEKALDYIISINRAGKYISEGMARIFLTKIMAGLGMNYMELRSPCGAALGQMAFYHDGNIYTCDEGRMIAEMGNKSFLLGNVNQTYDDLIDSKVCRGVCKASVMEGLTSCADCVYLPYCGVCPAVNYSLYGDIYERVPRNYRCKIYGGILDILFEKLKNKDDELMFIFRSWLS